MYGRRAAPRCPWIAGQAYPFEVSSPTTGVSAGQALRAAEVLRVTYPEADCELDFANPLQLLIATVLSAQCTDKRVNAVTPALFDRYPDAAAFAGADTDELEELIRTTGFYRAKARNIQGLAGQLCARFGGEVPAELDALVTLPGVGRKTANVVLGYAFGIPGITVDTHVGRVARRLGWTSQTDPVKVEQDLMQLLPQPDWTMVSQDLIWHGRRCCVARKPRCGQCPLATLCPSAEGATDAAETLPVAKKPKPAPKRRSSGALLAIAAVFMVTACSAADGNIAGERVSTTATTQTDGAATTSPRDPALAALIIAAGLAPCPDSDRTAVAIEPIGRVGGGLPVLTLPCLGDGPDVVLSGLRGTPMLINIWASWCPPCIAEMPYLAQAARDHSDELLVLGIDVQDRPGSALDLAAALDIGFASVSDPGFDIRAPLVIPGPPVTFFVDADGVIQGRQDGAFPTQQALAEQLSSYLGIDPA